MTQLYTRQSHLPGISGQPLGTTHSSYDNTGSISYAVLCILVPFCNFLIPSPFHPVPERPPLLWQP